MCFRFITSATRRRIMPMLHVEHSFWFLATILTVCVAAGSNQATADEKLKLLIIDGQNNHNWKTMTPPMKAELEKTGRFSVDVATTPPEKSPAEDWTRFRPDFSKYDVVLSNFNSMTEYWPEEGQLAL